MANQQRPSASLPKQTFQPDLFGARVIIFREAGLALQRRKAIQRLQEIARNPRHGGDAA